MPHKIELIDQVIIHCAATKPSMKHVDIKWIRKQHIKRGFAREGYHYFITREQPEIQYGRPISMQGAHVRGHNQNTIGICLAGGINEAGKPTNNFKQNQFFLLKNLLIGLRYTLPKRFSVKGHRDYSKDLNNDGIITRGEWMKECPCFEVSDYLKEYSVEL